MAGDTSGRPMTGRGSKNCPDFIGSGWYQLPVCGRLGRHAAITLAISSRAGSTYPRAFDVPARVAGARGRGKRRAPFR